MVYFLANIVNQWCHAVRCIIDDKMHISIGILKCTRIMTSMTNILIWKTNYFLNKVFKEKNRYSINGYF